MSEIRFAKEADIETLGDALQNDPDASRFMNITAGDVTKPLNVRHDAYSATFVVGDPAVAFISVSYNPISNDALIKELYVSKNNRKLGIGQKLLSHAVDFCYREWPHIRMVYAFTVDGNEGVESLNQSRGFKRAGHYEDLIVDGVGQTLWIYRKNISTYGS